MRWLVLAFVVGCGTAPTPAPVARPTAPASRKVAAPRSTALGAEPVVVPEAEPEPVEVPAAVNPAPSAPPAARALPAMPPERLRTRHAGNMIQRCYALALGTLEGRIVVRFVIERDGTVSSAVDGGSTLPNANVVACVIAAFRKLRFPAPEGGGRVTVTSPNIVTPGN